MDSLDGELLDGPLARLVFIYVGRFFMLVVVFFWGGAFDLSPAISYGFYRGLLGWTWF